MKTYLRTIGAISLCLLFQQMQASETPSDDTDQYQFVANQPVENQPVEKGAKSKSKAKIELDGLPSGKGSSCGAKGCTGPRGPMCSPAYAAAFQEEEKNFGGTSAGETVTLPFTTLDYAKDITLDALTDTFRLPKGVYTVRFQFMIESGDNYIFNPIYLDVGGSHLPLTWNGGAYDPANSQSLTSFSGASIFEAPADNTLVRICMDVSQGSNSSLIFKDTEAVLNYPTRIVFEQISAPD